jgi:hypothetical protein
MVIELGRATDERTTGAVASPAWVQYCGLRKPAAGAEVRSDHFYSDADGSVSILRGSPRFASSRSGNAPLRIAVTASTSAKTRARLRKDATWHGCCVAVPSPDDSRAFETAPQSAGRAWPDCCDVIRSRRTPSRLQVMVSPRMTSVLVGADGRLPVSTCSVRFVTNGSRRHRCAL